MKKTNCRNMRAEFKEAEFKLWPVWLCALLTLHRMSKRWSHTNYDGSGTDYFADGAYCRCGTKAKWLR